MVLNRPLRERGESVLRRASVSVVAILASLILALPGDGHASVIDNFPSVVFFTAFGEPWSPYFAQTFKALPGLATAVDFELERYFGSANVDFHLLITGVAGSGFDLHPSMVLFESGTISLPLDVPTIVSVPLPGLALVPGGTYAFVLDAFVTRHGVDSTAAVGMNGTYADGDFLFIKPFEGGTRADHFASDWYVARAIPYPPDFSEMAFRMTFVESVAQPPTLVLMSASLLLLTGLSSWRRRCGYRRPPQQ